MTSPRKFYRTTYCVTIYSERPYSKGHLPISHGEIYTFENLYDEVNNGDAKVGRYVQQLSAEEISAEELVEGMESEADIDFFGLDYQGNDTEEYQ